MVTDKFSVVSALSSLATGGRLVCPSIMERPFKISPPNPLAEPSQMRLMVQLVFSPVVPSSQRKMSDSSPVAP